jgi:hypothetical protein
MSNFYKIECLDCGINADLLTDVFHRIICRECLIKHEFKEVENEIYSESYREMESGHKILLQAANLAHGDDSCDGLQEFIENNGKL